MNKLLIVAAHELRSVIRTRAFWMQLLFVPAIFGMATVVPRLTGQQTTVYTIIDQTHDVGQPLASLMDQQVRDTASNFTLQPTTVRTADIPGIDVFQEPTVLIKAFEPYLKGEIKVTTGNGAQTLSAVVLVPAGFGASPDAIAEIISTRPVPPAFDQQVRGALSQILRSRALQSQGVDPQLVARIQNIVAPLLIVNPAGSKGVQSNARATLAARLLPIAFVILLFMSTYTAGIRLLSGVIEERSNKLVETILSSVTAGQFMGGKLLGIALVGLIVIVGWAGSAAVTLRAANGLDAVFAVLPDIISAKVAIVFVLYFLTAYVLYAAMFLAIGSVAESLQDAQGYMVPLVAISMAPMFLAGALINAPNGALAVVMSWIPLYTPFTMMLRLPFHPPMWQIIGTTITMLAFTASVVWSMSRIFRMSILASGSTLRVGQVWRILTARAGI